MSAAVFLVLSEWTLPILLWHLMMRRSVCIVAVSAKLPGIGRWLDGLKGRLCRRGLVKDLALSYQHLLPTRGFNATIDLQRLSAVYPEREEAMSAFFEFEELGERLASYARPYKHICSNAMLQNYVLLYTVHKIETEASTPVIGLDRQQRGLYQAIFGHPPVSRNTAGPMLIFNILIWLGASALGLWTALRLMRFRRIHARTMLLASDHSLDARDHILWSEVVENPADLLVICRTVLHLQTFRITNPDLCATTIDGGAISALGLIPAVIGCWREMARLFFLCHQISPATFREVVLLPWRRMRLRALFNTYHPRFFWSRDEYNPEHIIRTQELRRIGSVSMGIMHGVPSIYPCIEQVRYIDFDIFYVFGIDQYLRWYQSKWPAQMRVTAVGSFAFTRDELARLAAPARRDIACFLEPCFFDEQVFESILHLADSFPDRMVYVNVKSNRKVGEYGRMLKDLLSHGRPNLVEHTGRSYDLMFQCSYVVANGSTLGLEALQFGRAGFQLDFDKRWKHFYYRDFPELCVSNVQQLIERIRRLDSGEAYPRRNLHQVIDLSGRVIWDVIRQDMGLGARAPDRLLHLAFADREDSPLKFYPPPGDPSNVERHAS